MKIEEYIERVKKFKALLMARLPQFVAEQAMSTKSLLQLRVQERGEIGVNETVNAYTSEPYKKKREKRGRQTAFVDLTFTRGGAGMFGSTGLVLEEEANGIVKVSVGGRDEFTQNKLDWNSERYGDVLAPSKEEEAAIVERFDKWVFDLAVETGIA